MALLSIALLVVGAGLIVFGYQRARRPWTRYQTLKAQDENVSRYESWRGGLRDSGTTGASVAMELLRKQARDGAIISVAGVVLLIAGLVVH